jgi:hypothetical protein
MKTPVGRSLLTKQNIKSEIVCEVMYWIRWLRIGPTGGLLLA